MYKILAIVLMVGLLGPVPAAMAQEGMLRASAEAWKRQQAQQDKINRDLKGLEQEAARPWPSQSSTEQTKPKSRNRSVR